MPNDLHEIKHDGYRLIARLDGRTARLRGNGLDRAVSAHPCGAGGPPRAIGDDRRGSGRVLPEDGTLPIRSTALRPA
jgi:hypothetical protein